MASQTLLPHTGTFEVELTEEDEMLEEAATEEEDEAGCEEIEESEERVTEEELEEELVELEDVQATENLPVMVVLVRCWPAAL